MFSGAVARAGHCRQTSLACVGSTRSVLATVGLPPLMARVLHCSGSQLLYMERALSCVWFQFSGIPQKHRLRWACVLCLPSPSSSGSQELDGHTLPRFGAPSPLAAPTSVSQRIGPVVSVLGSWSLATTLPAEINHPESQEVFG